MKIRLNNLTKKIKNKIIINNIDAVWESGNVYGLQGHNGSGKTMLMRLISGLIRPSSGCVIVDEQVVGKDIEFPDSIGTLIENPSFLSSYRGIDNLLLLARIKNKINKKEIEDTLNYVGLDVNDKRKYRNYSLGMKQRLGIAAAIMEQPQIIILDEPTNALDEDGVCLVKEIVKREKERGALIILSCHESNHLEEMSDIVYQMENGTFTSIIYR